MLTEQLLWGDRKGQGLLAIHLLSRDEQDLMPSLFNAFFSTSDLDLIAGVLGSWDVDLSGRLQLKLLKFLTVLANHKAMVFLGDCDSS